MVYVADVQACEDGVCPSTTFNEQACSIGAALAPNAECKDTRCINRDACERGKLAKDFGGIDSKLYFLKLFFSKKCLYLLFCFENRCLSRESTRWL